MSRTRKENVHDTTDDHGVSPFFIVGNVDRTIAFYREKLGSETTFQEPDQNPFFAIISRDEAQLFVKSDGDVTPLPNPKRHAAISTGRFLPPQPSNFLAQPFQ